MKRILKWAGIVLGVVLVGAGGFLFFQVRAFDASMAKVYDIALPTVARSNNPAVLERGKHLAESLGACTTCHGANLAGGRAEPLGPLGTLVMPNITTGKDGLGTLYSDGQLARLIKHGVKRDGTSVRLMPAQDWSWWPDDDVAALISWVRTQPPVDGDKSAAKFAVMAKLLDRFDAIPIDVARRIDHANLPKAPAPRPDAIYGAFVASSCYGCHGATLSGGPIPGAPPGLAVPLNLTPHETGLKGWTYRDFTTLLREGKRKDGKALDPFMPVEALKNFNEVEMNALWAYLQSVPPRPFGER
jgi:mono/diheme cytochrome c family protein